MSSGAAPNSGNPGARSSAHLRLQHPNPLLHVSALASPLPSWQTTKTTNRFNSMGSYATALLTAVVSERMETLQLSLADLSVSLFFSSLAAARWGRGW